MDWPGTSPGRARRKDHEHTERSRTPTLWPLAALLSLALVACGSPSPTSPKTTVNDIVLTPVQLTVPLTTYDAGPYPMLSVLVGNSIYFGNWSNTAKTQFLTRYNIASNTSSSQLGVSSNVCSCGYSSKLTSDAVNIFYIANDATQYTASSKSWTKLTYPATAQNNNGEAGVVHYNGNLYFVGGRTPSTLFKYYNINEDKWFTAPNSLYATNRSQMAVYKDRVYVLGGAGAEKKMAYFSTSSNIWTPLSDVPFTVSSDYGSAYTAVLGDNLYLLQDGSIYIYDLVNDQWAAKPITITGLPDSANLFSDGLNLYIAGKNSSNIPAIFKITVSHK